MKLGMVLPQTARAASPAAPIEVATQAEKLGFDSVWVGDHIAVPESQESAYPYRVLGASG